MSWPTVRKVGIAPVTCAPRRPDTWRNSKPMTSIPAGLASRPRSFTCSSAQMPQISADADKDAPAVFICGHLRDLRQNTRRRGSIVPAGGLRPLLTYRGIVPWCDDCGRRLSSVSRGRLTEIDGLQVSDEVSRIARRQIPWQAHCRRDSPGIAAWT